MFKKSVQRLLSTNGRKLLQKRPISINARCNAIQPFLMPAMSPTMEKGGIVNWKFKVGDKFEAGDVLLEVETDKAQIDVEAQDDGQMVKIVVGDGAKDINVGATIAYLAEPEDDITQLEIPSGDVQKTVTESPNEPIKKESPLSNEKKSESKEPTLTNSNKLLPSVTILCAQNGISEQEAREKIVGSGFQGRILKGDVLAYLNKIPKESVDKVSEYVAKSSKLDLSNIEIKQLEPTTTTTSTVEITGQQQVKSEVKKEEASMKSVAPTPITFTEDIILSIPQDTTLTEIRQSMNNFIKEAYQISHETPISTSQYYDPIFEDLLTVDPREPRFQYDYNVMPMTGGLNQSNSRDIFDILSTQDKSSPKNNENNNEYLLTINVDVNGKYNDSVAKAEKFIDYIKQLEAVA